MPKISDEKRAARRAQILDAAWICFQKQGLHATTMDDIIQTSSLSAGAVYSYYPSKDDLILAAVTSSLVGLKELLDPLFAVEPPSSPADLLGEITGMINQFTARGGYDLKRIALLGWSEAQRNERLRATMRDSYLGFREQLVLAVRRWKCRALDDTTQDGERDLAMTLLSLVLGYVVQSAVIGDIQSKNLINGLIYLGEFHLTEIRT